MDQPVCRSNGSSVLVLYGKTGTPRDMKRHIIAFFLLQIATHLLT